MNPLSFEGNGINSAPDQLVFRAALGSELDIMCSFQKAHCDYTRAFIMQTVYCRKYGPPTE